MLLTKAISQVSVYIVPSLLNLLSDLLSLSASHLRFSLLLSLDLRLDCLPVHLDLLVQLNEAVIRLLLIVLLEEPLPVGDYCVDVGLLSDRDIQSLVPLVHLDVHLDHFDDTRTLTRWRSRRN